MNAVSDRLKQVLEEVAACFDGVPGAKGGSSATPEKHDEILSDSGHPYSGFAEQKKLGSCAGTYRGRPVSVSFHRGSELTISIRSSAPCLFRIVRNTLGARLNILGGRRVLSEDQVFDQSFIIRVSGGCGLDSFFQRSDVTSVMNGLMPFYSLNSKPGSMVLASDFDEYTVRPDQITGRLETLAALADTLEEATADSIARGDGGVLISDAE
ncbi:MAG: hypothetical protein AVO35_12380 [Candidatus Aegiribacteria sp. MLS_C]|nr:MAG: hypothetical protein AVO35_12380 [Candidatus Aegiribacteria sp. MLS_C]